MFAEENYDSNLRGCAHHHSGRCFGGHTVVISSFVISSSHCHFAALFRQ